MTATKFESFESDFRSECQSMDPRVQDFAEMLLVTGTHWGGGRVALRQDQRARLREIYDKEVPGALERLKSEK